MGMISEYTKNNFQTISLLHFKGVIPNKSLALGSHYSSVGFLRIYMG